MTVWKWPKIQNFVGYKFRNSIIGGWFVVFILCFGNINNHINCNLIMKLECIIIWENNYKQVVTMTAI